MTPSARPTTVNPAWVANTPFGSSMVSTNLRCTGVILLGLALGGLLACESTQQADMTSAGALPRFNNDAQPKINASTYVAHGELLERRGDYRRAAEQYQKALEVAPDLVTARNRLGVTLNKLGYHAQASTEFRRALLYEPNEAYLLNNLGFSLYLEGQYNEAEQVLTRAVELDPEFRRARMNHALVLARMGRYDDALQEFTRAGSEADAHYNIGVIQAEAGDYVEAVRSLDQALQIDPTLVAAREHLRQIARLAASAEAADVAATEAEEARAAAARQEADRVREAKAREEEAERLARQAQARVAEAKLTAEKAHLAAKQTEDQNTETTADSDSTPPEESTASVAHADEAASRAAAVEAARRTAETLAAETPDSPSPDVETAAWNTPIATHYVADWAYVAELYDTFELQLSCLQTIADKPSGPFIIAVIEKRGTRLFDEVVNAMLLDEPWADGCLRNLERFLGVSPEMP